MDDGWDTPCSLGLDAESRQVGVRVCPERRHLSNRLSRESVEFLARVFSARVPSHRRHHLFWVHESSRGRYIVFFKRLTYRQIQKTKIVFDPRARAEKHIKAPFIYWYIYGSTP